MWRETIIWITVISPSGGLHQSTKNISKISVLKSCPKQLNITREKRFSELNWKEKWMRPGHSARRKGRREMKFAISTETCILFLHLCLHHHTRACSQPSNPSMFPGTGGDAPNQNAASLLPEFEFHKMKVLVHLWRRTKNVSIANLLCVSLRLLPLPALPSCNASTLSHH